MAVTDLTVWELADQLRDGRLDPADVLTAQLARIAALNPALHAYIETFESQARARVEALQRQPARGRLWGVPIAIKDNICITGEPATCASKILQGFRPPYSATVITRLEAAGAVLLGRTNQDEFAFGSSTETSCYGVTRNPWDVERIPGGSSGGSACAVAADLAAVALGSDTGGSIRQPAAMCGIVGLKPTYGRVSRYGLIAFASSLDQIGPLAKDVRDAALLLSVIAGGDPRDSTCPAVPVPDYAAALTKDVRGVKIGVPQEYFVEGADPDVSAAIEQAIKQLEQLGAVIKRITLPHTPYAVATYYIVATAEASSNLARYDGVQYGLRDGSERLLDMYERTRAAGFGDEAKRRIILGTYVLSHGYYDAYYLKAQKVRTLIRRDFEEAFTTVDAILTPTAPTAAFALGEKMSDPLQMYLSDIFTISANLAGVPALSLPCGFTREMLPIGLQVLAAPFREETVLRVAHAYEQATDWHRRSPPLQVTSDK